MEEASNKAPRGKEGPAQSHKRPRDYSQVRGSCWQGCKMVSLCGGLSTERSDVNKLAEFVNSIHTWGEGRHADGIVQDMAMLSRAAGGID